MSSNINNLGANIYPNWYLVLPNAAWDEPNIMQVPDANGILVGVSIREYLNHPSSNVGLIQNRRVMPLKAGTHSIAPFDMDKEDILANETLITTSGMIDGLRDFTLNLPNLAYQMPHSAFIKFLAESPLNVEPEVI